VLRPEEHAAGDAGALASPVPEDFATRFAQPGHEFVSWGHAGGRFFATVFVNPEAKDVVFRGGALPAGTMLVMTHVEKTTRKPGPTYFMQKEGASWRFGVSSGDGGKDALALCARCHTEAPHDAVFVLP